MLLGSSSSNSKSFNAVDRQSTQAAHSISTSKMTESLIRPFLTAPIQDRALQAGIADCYEQGLVKAIGVSNYGPKQLLKFYKYLEARDIPLATAQV